MTQFYQEDIVQRIDDPNSYGVVLRCWHDPDEILTLVGLEDPLLRPLQQSEVGVSFFPSGHREILLGSEFNLVDRTFEVGDVCKRSTHDVRSGVVVQTNIKARLEHAISGEPLHEWKDRSEIVSAMDVEIGDYVVYDDWVGQVVESFDETLVELPSGQLMQIPEPNTKLTVGDKGSDLIPHAAFFVPNVFNYFNPSSTGNPTVVATKHTVLAISWLAINQSLDPVEAQSRRRPHRLWCGESLNQLTLVRTRPDTVQVGEKVLLKNSEGTPVTKHGKEGEGAGVVEVRHFVVRETKTTVTVLWQDDVKEIMPSTELIPFLNPDEYDCWPGDPVIWKGGHTTRPAIVQSVNSAERTAYIRYKDVPWHSSNIELASLLELDTRGTYASSAQTIVTENLGVHRGDFVLIHRPNTTNGLSNLRVPRIGELESWVHDTPALHARGRLYGWRREMSEMGARIAATHSKGWLRDDFVRRPGPGDTTTNWFGEVTDLWMDGSVEVTLPDSSVVVLQLERLTRLYDGLEEFLGDGSSEDQVNESSAEDLEIWDTDGPARWRVKDPDDSDEWEDEGSMMSYVVLDEAPSWNDSISGDSSLSPVSSTITTVQEPVPSLSDPTSLHEEALSEAEVDPSHWKRFDILPSAPTDHAFYRIVPSHPSRAFLGRLNKEYKALSSSLPETIIVRAYEDRTDLLRSLIIGPENTPYEDAPFVIDWRLGYDFPVSAPVAHFMSWTNGNGRVNPNLYEDGKVCLSILGTWEGDQDETWSAARSSLLQAFVSIQGLVLVKEPYFCEPAYEKFRFTEEGTVNSRLYNEKAYVLSRGFILRALELELGGLNSELRWLYFSNGRLDKVLRDARALIECSEVYLENDRRDVAVPRLTAGGIISLRRVLDKLTLMHNSGDVGGVQ